MKVEAIKCQDCGRIGLSVDDRRITPHKCSGRWTTIASSTASSFWSRAWHKCAARWQRRAYEAEARIKSHYMGDESRAAAAERELEKWDRVGWALYPSDPDNDGRHACPVVALMAAKHLSASRDRCERELAELRIAAALLRALERDGTERAPGGGT